MPYNDADPTKDRARQKLIKAVYSGAVVRPDKCYICNDYCVPQGHHSDYGKPLVVTWLCSSCHTDVHNGKDIAPELDVLQFAKDAAKRII